MNGKYCVDFVCVCVCQLDLNLNWCDAISWAAFFIFIYFGPVFQECVWSGGWFGWVFSHFPSFHMNFGRVVFVEICSLHQNSSNMHIIKCTKHTKRSRNSKQANNHRRQSIPIAIPINGLIFIFTGFLFYLHFGYNVHSADRFFFVRLFMLITV